MNSSVPQADEDNLRQRLRPGNRGEVMSPEAAHATAQWFAGSIGPGFQVFLASGLVTAALYSELARLYDVRSDQGGAWLDALVRYSLWQSPSTGDESPETGT